MSKAVEFWPRTSGDAAARVHEFVDFASKGLADVLVRDASYSDTTWDVTNAFVVKGLKSRFRLHFVNSDAKVDRGGFRGDPLAAPFIDFAKACIRYRHATAPVSYSATNRRVFGLRCVEAAFRDLGRAPEIWRLDPVTMNRAVELGTTGAASSTAYKIGSELETLYKFCVEMQLLASKSNWSHGVYYPGKASIRVGEEFNSRHADKPRSPTALHTLDEAFYARGTWADQVYYCVAALLLTIPIKPHELLQLRVRPEIERTGGGEHGTELGLQIWPGKGDPPRVEWASNPEHAAVAKRAVRALREMLAPARELARWYEHSPSRLYLPPHLEHLRQAEWLTVGEVQEIIGVSRATAYQWIDDKGIAKRVSDRREGRGRGHGKGLTEVWFGDVERAILSLLPKDFPYVNGDRSGHRYSEALLVAPVNALHAARSPWRCMFEPIGYEQFYKWLRERMKGAPPADGEAELRRMRRDARLKAGFAERAKAST